MASLFESLQDDEEQEEKPKSLFSSLKSPTPAQGLTPSVTTSESFQVPSAQDKALSPEGVEAVKSTSQGGLADLFGAVLSQSRGVDATPAQSALVRELRQSAPQDVDLREATEIDTSKPLGLSTRS
jgi:hypothetical protein